MAEKIEAQGTGGQNNTSRPPIFDQEEIERQIDSVPMTYPDGTPMTSQEIADAFAAESLSTSPDLLGS